MGVKRIMRGAYLVSLGGVNAVLLEQDRELVLIDTGFPSKESAVFDAIRQIGRRPGDLGHVVFTHAHIDHIGSGAAIARETGATTWIHQADAPIARSGGPFRPMSPAPALPARIAYALIWRPEQRAEPIRINETISDGDVLPLVGGLRAVHVPGHCAGQVALLWQGRGLLLAADVGTHVVSLGDPLGFEDEAEGRRSQRKLAALDFEAASFGHGRPILANAAARFRRKWAR